MECNRACPFYNESKEPCYECKLGGDQTMTWCTVDYARIDKMRELMMLPEEFDAYKAR
ncbi:hypothetical protein M0R72_21975 [Candidatus Pacearchaeota archaeon]|jgi:hypothetical protein|nr:hypothetical protein [Candidatus Pacearchaeota archaeon]